MKNKKVIIVSVIFAIILITLIGVFIYFSGRENIKKAENAVLDFFSLIEEDKYEDMYNMVVDINISKEDFVTRNKNIYEGIDAENIKIDITNCEKKDGKYNVTYNEKMDTSAGSIEFTKTATVSNDFKIYWNDSYIFPNLTANEKVRVSTVKSKRGSILDRNGVALAEDGKISQVGLVPRKNGRE